MNYETEEAPYRYLVAGVDTQVPLANGNYGTYVNFDNAATTPPFNSVIKDIISFSPWYSSIHRGNGYKSQISSNIFESSRETVLNFVHADSSNDTVIYVKNTTEGINKLSFRLCTGDKKCVVLSTNMEHHSNDLPWRDKYKLDYIELDKQGKLSLKDLEQKLINYNGAVKLVTVSGASNVTGYINPIYEVAKLAHKHNAKILVDGAQLVPHSPVDMKPESSLEHIDFLVFSAHKMYAPFGIGVLIGPKAAFMQGAPDYKGGGTVDLVTHEYVAWNEPPEKEEAGTPNVMGVVALVSAIKTLTSIGMKNIDTYERSLAYYALSSIKNIKDIELYASSEDINNRVSIIPFNIKGMPHSIVSEILSLEAGIAVRTGCFCAHPYVQKLLDVSGEDISNYLRTDKSERPGMIRLSFGLYNSFSEIDYFLRVLKYIINNKQYFLNKYSNHTH
ncbi:aminotransferase class V-fold PLP-dependent enzyme [Clostridium sp. YIM B02515]|uniref:Aminotransferase class V-fold PLP-dependent enzyme n=1 Tax=Clostridium rhizosphaerae TaxID=2803861 RepID=A0ABS1TAV3_9CLOT|nr:aminotransferase class V-fold PLP-dependent enzyme [Clostridium rhizosphaerae]MBL4936482.1 aminotransferase class V-fold PLP-dependent enzyme [Clostridium rhizosphaerae]